MKLKIGLIKNEKRKLSIYKNYCCFIPYDHNCLMLIILWANCKSERVEVGNVLFTLPIRLD